MRVLNLALRLHADLKNNYANISHTLNIHSVNIHSVNICFRNSKTVFKVHSNKSQSMVFQRIKVSGKLN